MKSKSDIGLIGLAVMGQNLALNIADHGFQISVYNRTTAKTDEFVAGHPGTPGGLVGTKTLEEFVSSLATPRKIVILVQAGKATDAVIDGLVPLLQQGDIIIDGGNSLYEDTIRREKDLKAKGLRFVGSGVSGGEEGARFGPSLMPGGDLESWKELEPIWKAVAAKVDAATGKPIEGAAPGKPVQGGVPCTTYIGPNGAGHYVKMVHNGIEYGDMQLICEAYNILRHGVGLSVSELHDVFTEWNNGDLDSFLIEITGKILGFKDPVTGAPAVDVILDRAGQKGTGKWTINSALDMGIPASTMSEAVFARCLSALKDERVAAAKVLKGPANSQFEGNKAELIQAVRDSLYASKICSYAQGFALMRAASEQYNWNLNYGEIAMIFRGGCIIRARFLQRIKDAFDKNAKLPNLLLDPYFKDIIEKTQHNWRRIVSQAALTGIPVPAYSASLAYFDSYRSERLPANLLQAQRDYFGSHTYERVDQPRGKFFHLDWVGDKQQHDA
ncbi:MAG: NADP-dependent phosphogluconate dehydrogenase [Verrucomicrobiales bacterium]|jgi:6-phosphogluconate dehydrogenase|nr:NADP-dependent phosphogluconate dehydrogenase [Verrucomicrobiales bacterium]